MLFIVSIVVSTPPVDVEPVVTPVTAYTLFTPVPPAISSVLFPVPPPKLRLFTYGSVPSFP